MVPTPNTASASLGMGNCQEDPDEECVPQKESTGNDTSDLQTLICGPRMMKMPTRDGPDDQETQTAGEK